jgi:hypothetical protein
VGQCDAAGQVLRRVDTAGPDLGQDDAVRLDLGWNDAVGMMLLGRDLVGCTWLGQDLGAGRGWAGLGPGGLDGAGLVSRIGWCWVGVERTWRRWIGAELAEPVRQHWVVLLAVGGSDD